MAAIIALLISLGAFSSSFGTVSEKTGNKKETPPKVVVIDLDGI